MKIWPLLLAGTMLAACTTDMGTDMGGGSASMESETSASMEGDMTDGDQMTAFQEVDARLGYDNAEIAYDDNNCAYYSATGPEGEPFREQLTDADGAPICANMQS